MIIDRTTLAQLQELSKLFPHDNNIQLINVKDDIYQSCDSARIQYWNQNIMQNTGGFTGAYFSINTEKLTKVLSK